MTRYAEGTTVTSAKSKAEIEATLGRYGADQFIYGWMEDQAVVGFRMHERQIKFVLPLPGVADFTETPTGRARSIDAQRTEYEKATRQRWRALALVIKAKLEAVESGITEFDDEFMAHIVLPSGETVGSWMKPQIAIAYDSGDMPPLLPAPRGR